MKSEAIFITSHLNHGIAVSVNQHQAVANDAFTAWLLLFNRMQMYILQMSARTNETNIIACFLQECYEDFAGLGGYGCCTNPSAVTFYTY